MFDDRHELQASDVKALVEHVSDDAPETSAQAYAALPALLAQGDDTPQVIHARIDLALLTALDGFLQSALYQIDELTKDARRVSDTSGDTTIISRADTARDLIETAAQHAVAQ